MAMAHHHRPLGKGAAVIVLRGRWGAAPPNPRKPHPEVCPDLSNPADFFMTMMSIESIELDAETQSQTGAVLVTKDQIEQEY